MLKLALLKKLEKKSILATKYGAAARTECL